MLANLLFVTICLTVRNWLHLVKRLRGLPCFLVPYCTHKETWKTMKTLDGRHQRLDRTTSGWVRENCTGQNGVVCKGVAGFGLQPSGMRKNQTSPAKIVFFLCILFCYFVVWWIEDFQCEWRSDPGVLLSNAQRSWGGEGTPSGEPHRRRWRWWCYTRPGWSWCRWSGRCVQVRCASSCLPRTAKPARNIHACIIIISIIIIIIIIINSDRYYMLYNVVSWKCSVRFIS